MATNLWALPSQHFERSVAGHRLLRCLIMTKPTNLPSLTALRIVAASLVFLSHGLILPIFANPGAANVYGLVAHNMGAIGVLFFFVLSGFVLTWSAKDSDTPGKFWRRRFFKIYPNHFVAYVIYLALFLAWA